MKKLLGFLIIASMFVSCEEKPKENNIFQGTYEMTKQGLVSEIGIWVFSDDEISLLISNKDKNHYANLSMIAVQKYYVKDNFIYTCLCNTSDCLDENNFEKIWKIQSVTETDSKRTIQLLNVNSKIIKIKLEKNKSIGLDVKDWE